MGLDSNLSCARSLAPTSSGVVGGGKLPHSLCTYSDGVGLESLLHKESGSDFLWGWWGEESYLTHCVLTLMGLHSNLSCARSLAPTSSGVVGGGKLPGSLCWKSTVSTTTKSCQSICAYATTNSNYRTKYYVTT